MGEREEKILSCRVNSEELKILERYFNGSFSNFVHTSLADVKKKSFFEKTLQPMVMLGLGVILLMYAISSTNLASFLIAFLLSVFFVITSLLNLYYNIRSEIKVREK